MSTPVGPYTPITVAGDWLIVSGQVGIAAGRLVEGGIEAELRQAMANLAELLESHGASLADVVKTTVFLVDIDDYAVMNEVYIDVLDRTAGGHRPSRSAMAVAALPIGAQVEIEAWAVRPGSVTSGSMQP